MFTASEAAEYKGVHVKSVYRATTADPPRLAFEVRYGVKLISKEALDAWQPWQPGPRKKKKTSTE